MVRCVKVGKRRLSGKVSERSPFLSIAFTFVCRDGATTQRHSGKRYSYYVREICTSSISFTFSYVQLGSGSPQQMLPL